MHNRKSAGYILLELLLSLMLSSLVITLIYSLYQVANTAYEKQLDRAEVQYAATNAMQMICRDIEEGKSIAVLNDGAMLKITKADRTERYYLSSGTIIKYYKTGIPVADNISVLSFKPLSEYLIEITIIAERGQERLALKTWCAKKM